MVTHNMQQASRTSDYTGFMYLGRLIEYGPTANCLPILICGRLRTTSQVGSDKMGHL